MGNTDAGHHNRPPSRRTSLSRMHRLVQNYWSSDTAVMLSLAAVVGVVTGFGAVGFIRAIQWATRLFFDVGGDALSFMGRWYVVVIPAVGGLLVGPLVHFLAPEAKGHGVPEVMAAISLRGGRIRPAVIGVKAVGSILTIGSGGSVGREGPIVQIGAAVGSFLAQRLRLSERRIIALVAAGAAAGVAATFNAPIAGVMFALEVLVGIYSVRAVGTMVFAAVSGATVARFLLGDHPAFAVPSYSLLSAWELPMYAGLGIACALAAGAFVRILYFSEDLFDRWRFPAWLKPISDVERAAVRPGAQPTVGEACTRNLVCAFASEPVARALSRAGEAGVHRMPVVNAADHTELVGMLTSADMVRAYNRLFTARR